MRGLAPVLAVVLAAAACNGAGPAAPEATTGGSEEARVVGVADGDSIVVELDGEQQEVRLLGINAPELDECLGPEARDRLGGILEGTTVTLVAGPEDRDQFSRLLRYLELDGADVNRAALAAGMALALSEDHPRREGYWAAEVGAVADRAGMWSPAACGRPPPPAVGIAAVEWDPPGPDAEDLYGELVEIGNEGDGPVDLGGWTLRDESTRWRYRFPAGFSLGPGGRVVVRTGCGEDDATELFWCAGDPVWSNGGDTALLLDGNGNLADRWVYGPKAES